MHNFAQITNDMFGVLKFAALFFQVCSEALTGIYGSEQTAETLYSFWYAAKLQSYLKSNYTGYLTKRRDMIRYLDTDLYF